MSTARVGKDTNLGRADETGWVGCAGRQTEPTGGGPPTGDPAEAGASSVGATIKGDRHG